MSIETTITIDDETCLHDEGEVLVVVQLVEGSEPHSVHLAPENAVRLAAAIMSRLNA